MKILHIAWAIISRNTSLAEYVNNLLEQEQAMGWETFCLFPGRYDQKNPPFQPRLLKYRKNYSLMYEIVNSPNTGGGEQEEDIPEMDLNQPQIEELFRIVLNDIKPDLIHFHEFIHLCSSLIDIAKEEFHIPLFMTCHDYFLFCPIVKLFDFEGKNCIESNIGKKCPICIRKAKEKPISLTQKIYHRIYLLSPGLYRVIEQKKIIVRISKIIDSKKRIRSLFISLKHILRKIIIYIPLKKRRNPQIQMEIGNSIKFQKRRDINIARLKKIDLFMPHSYGCAEVYKRYLGSDQKNIFPIDPIHQHLDKFVSNRISKINKPIRFGTIAGFVTKAKGADLLLEVVETLNQQGYQNDFCLIVLGSIDPRIKNRVLAIPNIINRGYFETETLNDLMNEIDVGIVPSIWEEVFGVVGTEFLAKGIPIIGNKRGGISDYTINNKTGWLNESASAKEMVEIVKNIIHSPQQIIELNKKINAIRSEFIYPMKVFYMKIENLYQKIIRPL